MCKWISPQMLCGNAAMVDSMEKSHDFPTLPTMTWIPLRGTHIPTKPATIIFLSVKNQNRGTLQKD
jgi:hypothetical protein